MSYDIVNNWIEKLKSACTRVIQEKGARSSSNSKTDERNQQPRDLLMSNRFTTWHLLDYYFCFFLSYIPSGETIVITPDQKEKWCDQTQTLFMLLQYAK